jgi:hypothetical protein
MYTLAPLLACLAPLLAFRQAAADAPDEPQLATSLLIKDGQVAMQDVHPLLTLTNIRLAAPQVPADGADIGEKLSAFLEQSRQAAVGKVLTAFAIRKKLTPGGPAVLADVKLTARSGAYRNKIIRQGRFVGLALRPTSTSNIVVRITGLGTQFTARNPDFRLYLYHSSQPTTPLAQYDVPRLDTTYFEWTPLAIELPVGPTPGEYRLGYFEDDLVGQAIDLDHDFSTRPGTGGCCGRDYLLFDEYAKYVQVRAFSALADTGTDVLPGEGKPTYFNNANFGLNLQLSAHCDLSAYFCRYQLAFAEALQLQLAVDLLSLMANSTRNNGIASSVQVLANMELNNKPDYQPGLLSKLEKALAAMEVDFSGVGAPCMPCKPKNGVRVGAI